MKTRGLPAICLGPTGNIQGTYNFLNLTTGSVIKRQHFDKHPAPDSVINRVTTLAGASGVSPQLVFADRHKQPYDWPNDTANPRDGLDPTPTSSPPGKGQTQIFDHATTRSGLGGTG